MREYKPDNWVLLEIKTPHEEKLYKVLAGWSGGYLDGDSWRLNSGVTCIEEDDTHYKFHGWSGSVYVCHKETELPKFNLQSPLTQLLDTGKVKVVETKDIKDEINE